MNFVCLTFTRSQTLKCIRGILWDIEGVEFKLTGMFLENLLNATHVISRQSDNECILCVSRLHDVGHLKMHYGDCEIQKRLNSNWLGCSWANVLNTMRQFQDGVFSASLFRDFRHMPTFLAMCLFVYMPGEGTFYTIFVSFTAYRKKPNSQNNQA